MTTAVSGVPKEDRISKRVKLLVFILILAFYGLPLVHKIELPFADDMARHIKNGELIMRGHFEVISSNVYSYTEPDFPFVNHHWLSGVVFYLVHKAVGWSGLVVFKVVILLAAFAILFLTALKKADFWLVALCSLPTIVILFERTVARPENFSYLFLALFLYLLTDLEEHPEQKRIFWLIPLQLLWVNLHIFFIIGPMLVGGLLLEKIILHFREITRNLLIRKLTALLLLLILVSFINPNGWKGALQPLSVFRTYGMAASGGGQAVYDMVVSEDQPISYFFTVSPFWQDFSIVTFFPMALLLALSFLFNFRKKPIFYFLGAIGTAFIGFSVIRTLPFFGFIFLLAISTNFNELFCAAKERLKRMSGSMWNVYGNILIGALALFTIYLIVLGAEKKFTYYQKPGVGLTPHAEDSAIFFKVNALKGPIFNNFDSGSYLTYELFPEEQVFLLNVPEAHSFSFFSDLYLPMMQSEVAWKTLSEQYHINVIFLYQYDEGADAREFLWRRARDSAWSLVYADEYNVIFVRKTPENDAIIQKFQITPQNAPERLAHLVQSQNFDEQFAAASVFNLLGLADLAEATLFRVVSRWPHEGRIWMLIGESELFKNNKESSQLALLYLDKAITFGWNTSEVYSFIGAAHLSLGQTAEAKEALLHALRINPERQDARSLLDDIEKSMAASPR